MGRTGLKRSCLEDLNQLVDIIAYLCRVLERVQLKQHYCEFSYLSRVDMSYNDSRDFKMTTQADAAFEQKASTFLFRQRLVKVSLHLSRFICVFSFHFRRPADSTRGLDKHKNMNFYD